LFVNKAFLKGIASSFISQKNPVSEPEFSTFILHIADSYLYNSPISSLFIGFPGVSGMHSLFILMFACSLFFFYLLVPIFNYI